MVRKGDDISRDFRRMVPVTHLAHQCIAFIQGMGPRVTRLLVRDKKAAAAEDVASLLTYRPGALASRRLGSGL